MNWYFQVYWSYGNSDDNRIISQSSGSTVNLTWSRPVNDMDTGSYTCVASNNLAEFTVTANLTITSK